KSLENEPGKTTVDTEVESMFIVPIHQASSSVPPLSTPADSGLIARVSELEKRCVKLEKKNNNLENTTQNLGSRVFILELRDLPYKIDQIVNEVVKDAVRTALQAPLRERFRDLPKADMKEMLHQWMFESGSHKAHHDHTNLYEALEDDQDPPPPLNDSDKSKKKMHDADASASSQPQAQTSSAWKSSDTRDAPSGSSKKHTNPRADEPIDDDPIPAAEPVSNSKDIDRPETPTPDWTVPPNDLPETENNWANTKLSKADLEGPAFEIVRPFHKNNLSLQYQMEKCHLLLTGQVDLVNPEGSKERRHEQSISKLKVAKYHDFGLEELIPNSAPSNRGAVMSHMRIHSVISLKTYTRYGYAFLKEIVLHKADYKDYNISEADFRNLHPNDFEDIYMLHLQRNLNHLFGDDKVNLYNADASDFLFKADYTIIHKPRAVIYKDRNDQKKMMRLDEVHKFSDGTLARILEKLDHMVKDFVLFKFKPGMDNRIWSEVDKRRSKEFIKAIERRLKIRRSFCSLECFVGGRLRDVDYKLITRTE
ncbi:hypothetical protein Tco_0983318, partial [Tanacetum coccineum]